MTCACGCGGITKLAERTVTKRGQLKGQPLKFIHGHNSFGANSYNWKGGSDIKPRGYINVYARNHPRAYRGRMLEHIIVAERALGRLLPDGAVVHHVNLNTSDNLPSNLVICENQSYHRLLHKRMRRLHEQRISS